MGLLKFAVYGNAYIWQVRRGEPLDQTTISATDFPSRLLDVQCSGNLTVFDIELIQTKVASTMSAFAETAVCVFPAAPVARRPMPELKRYLDEYGDDERAERTGWTASNL